MVLGLSPALGLCHGAGCGPCLAQGAGLGLILGLALGRGPSLASPIN